VKLVSSLLAISQLYIIIIIPLHFVPSFLLLLLLLHKEIVFVAKERKDVTTRKEVGRRRNLFILLVSIAPKKYSCASILGIQWRAEMEFLLQQSKNGAAWNDKFLQTACFCPLCNVGIGTLLLF
jgi:hypothetical protein